MTRPSDRHATPGLRIGQVHFTAGRPINDAHAQALGQRLAVALDEALVRAGDRSHVSIGELSVELGADWLDDERSLARVADSLARRILDRVPD